MNIFNIFDCSIKKKQQFMFKSFTHLIAQGKAANSTAYDFYKKNENAIFNAISFKKENYSAKENQWIFDNFIILCLTNYFEENTQWHKCAVNLFCNEKKLSLQLSCRFENYLSYRNHLNIRINVNTKGFVVINDDSMGLESKTITVFSVDDLLKTEFLLWIQEKKNTLINLPHNRKKLIELLSVYPERKCSELRNNEDIKSLNCVVSYEDSGEKLIYKKIEQGSYPFIINVDSYSFRMTNEDILYSQKIRQDLQAYINRKKIEILFLGSKQKKAETHTPRI